MNRIIKAEIRRNVIMQSEVHVVYEDGSTGIPVVFYADEISFSPREFIGLTKEEARHLHFRKDRAYLTS